MCDGKEGNGERMMGGVDMKFVEQERFVEQDAMLRIGTINFPNIENRIENFD